jgi:hypothetical protein
MEVLKMEKEYMEITPEVWKPEKEGDSCNGELVRKEVDVGPNKSRLYYLKGEDGDQFSVWGSTVLDNRMDFVNLGDYIRITYKGTQKNKRGQDTKIYKVEVAKTKQEGKAIPEIPVDQVSTEEKKGGIFAPDENKA